MRITSALVVAVICMVGCQAKPRDDARSHVIVHATTQPLETPAEGSPSAPPPRRVEVTVRDPANPSASTSSSHAMVGRVCRVQFRRDALGMATPAPLPLGSDSAGAGRAVSISGRVVMAGDGWVVLESDGRTCWIPQAAILVITVQN